MSVKPLIAIRCCLAAATMLSACSRPEPGGPNAPLENPPALERSPLPAALPAESMPPPVPPPETSRRDEPQILHARYFTAATTLAERREILRTLGMAATPEALAVLGAIFRAEKRAEAKMEVLEVLGDLDPEQNRDGRMAIVAQAIAPIHPRLVRLNAIELLDAAGDPAARELLRTLASDRDAEVRAAAAAAAARMPE